MNQNASGQIKSDALAEESEVQGITSQQRSEVIPANNAASDVIVQCLLIAARRGRQIRLAREQAVQLQQSESALVSEETRQSDGT